MDQLRKALAWLKAQHFWVLAGLVALIALACWWTAAGTLSAQYKENHKKITDEFTSLQNLRNSAFHANETINARQAAEMKKQAEWVAQIWERLYERQRENVLEWPPQLSQAFRDYVEKLEFGDDIPVHLRQNYTDYVQRHFPTLPKKIDARVMHESELGQFGTAGRGEFMPRGPMMTGPMEQRMGPDGLPIEEEDYICEWLNQGDVRNELTFATVPSATRIWVTQENLWVYHTLLDVIRNTNQAAGATRMSNAAVRVIHFLEVGQTAAPHSRTRDRIYKIQTAAAATMPGEMMEPGAEALGPEGGPMDRGGEMPFSPGRFGEGGPGGDAVSPEQEAAFLLTHRYLDPEGKPIPAGGVGAAMDEFGGGEAAPAGPVDMSTFGREYKRLPVRMVMQMDRRWLQHLIAECASQPLQVEVQEVRINPPGGAGEGGMGMSYGGGMRSFEGGGMGGSLFPDMTGIQTFDPQPHIVTVVVQGVIYIFKKPDPSVLQPTEPGAMTAGI